MQPDATAVVTFSVAGNDTAAAIAWLVDLGFEFGPSADRHDDARRHVRRAVARRRSPARSAHSRGARARSVGPGNRPCSSRRHQGAQGAERSSAGTVSVAHRRSLTDVRALLAQVRVRMACSTGVCRDAPARRWSIAELNEDVHALGRPHAERSATIEIHSVPGYARQAGRVVEALRERGLEPRDLDTLAQCAAAAGVDLAGFRAVTSIPLDRRMPAIDGFRAVLANLEVSISANWQGAIDQTDTKFLHDLRIAVRRTRTVLAAAKSVIPASILEPASAGFAWLGRRHGTRPRPRRVPARMGPLHRAARPRHGVRR